MISEKLLNDFKNAYIEAIYFTETGDGVQPESDIEESEQFLKDVETDCALFLQKYAHLIESHLFEQAGHDFWLTRNGHGAGFWDRGDLYGSNETIGDIGDYLSKQVGWKTEFEECYTYEGDDGLLYLD